MYAFVKMRAVGWRSCQDGSGHLIQECSVLGPPPLQMTSAFQLPFLPGSQGPSVPMLRRNERDLVLLSLLADLRGLGGKKKKENKTKLKICGFASNCVS